MDVDPIVGTIRRKLEDSVGSLSSGMGRLKSLFSDMDLNRDGRLSKREMFEAFRSLRMGITMDDIDRIFAKYDSDRSGDIDYKEFLSIIDFIPPSQQSGSAEALVARLRRQLEDKMGSLSSGMGRLKEIFSDIDDNDDGKLSQRELFDGLDRLRMNFTHEEIGVIFAKYDTDHSGKLSYEVSNLMLYYFLAIAG